MMKWTKIEKLNEWTGETKIRYIAEVMTSDRVGRAYLQVMQVGDKYQWSTHIVVAHKPKLSRMAYGSVAVTPQSLAVAKMLASRRSLKTIRAVEPLTRAA